MDLKIELTRRANSLNNRFFFYSFTQFDIEQGKKMIYTERNIPILISHLRSQ